MKKKHLFPFFLIALSLTLTTPFPLHSFSPFLAFLYRRSSLIYTLWVSAGCGFILDLLGVHPFGTQTLIFSLLALILFRYQIFFIDKPIGLASYTLIISLCHTLLNRLAYFLFDPSFPFTLKGFGTDFLIYPFIDALYSLLCFSFPLFFYRFLKKQWNHFHFLKKDSRKKEEEKVHGT
ncbi:MAG: hypothetical protein KDK76_05225 [Chlamydiia bacterium]|nr:hypothetical protein [Chlamydiia bacterium]